MATMLNAWLNDSLGHPADLIHLGVHPDDDDDTHDDDTHDSYPPPTQTWQATTATTKTQQQRQHDCDCDNGGNATTFFVLHGDRGYNPRYRPMVVRYTTVFVYRGVESYTAGLTHGYGCGVGAGAVSRVAGTVPGNDTRGATRVVPYVTYDPKTCTFEVRHESPNQTRVWFGVRKKRPPNRTAPDRGNPMNVQQIIRWAAIDTSLNIHGIMGMRPMWPPLDQHIPISNSVVSFTGLLVGYDSNIALLALDDICYLPHPGEVI
ncbi:hypothetical protein EDB85DRAFT_1898995 [Lactarius pseudohatsudake]|nr:hypothetical protein EDB85DRAFT_1898995 [Lactarius pseudohatsudake]